MSQIPTSTSTEFAIDTNVAIAFLNNATGAAAKLGGSARIMVPVAVWGELYFGAQKSARVVQNVARVESFLASVRTLVCDINTAREYGRIKKDLRAKGRPIPDNDMWIAATAIQYNLRLLTNDNHFTNVDRLQIEKW